MTQTFRQPAVYVSRLFVEPDHRRSGAGRALLDHARRSAIELGNTPALDVVDTPTTAGAIALYHRAGWAEIGTVNFDLLEVELTERVFVFAGEGTSPRTLEDLSDRAMPGSERHRVGQWMCRAALGATGRANSCTPSGNPDVPSRRAVDEVEAWFAARSLQPRFQVWDGSDAGIVEVLDRRGYATAAGADVLVRSLHRADWRPLSSVVQLAEVNADQTAAHDAPPRRQELMMSQLPKVIASIPGGTSPSVSSGVAVFDGSALGIFAMQTEPEWQRRGLARSVLSALLDAGVARNADMVWLQVMSSNAPAKALYDDFGFDLAHAYHYRAAPIG